MLPLIDKIKPVDKVQKRLNIRIFSARSFPCMIYITALQTPARSTARDVIKNGSIYWNNIHPPETLKIERVPQTSGPWHSKMLTRETFSDRLGYGNWFERFLSKDTDSLFHWSLTHLSLEGNVMEDFIPGIGQFQSFTKGGWSKSHPEQKCFNLFNCSFSTLAIGCYILHELMASSTTPHVCCAATQFGCPSALSIWKVLWDSHILVAVLFDGQEVFQIFYTVSIVMGSFILAR